MRKQCFLFLILISTVFLTVGQETKKGFFMPKKIGILYSYGNENNFISDDPDYYYKTNTFKGQFFYDIGNWKAFDFELIVQPQFQLIKHQLLNKYFVTEDYGDVLNKQLAYTALKTIQFYAVEFGLSSKYKLFEKLNFNLTASVGGGYINTETERVAKGFTFLENFSIGFTYKTSINTEIYWGGNWGHVSNLNFQFPNSGYNVAGVDIGFHYIF